MLTTNKKGMDASIDRVFRLAADVQRWPDILPHYRWVRLRRDENDRTIVEMAARRDFIPIKWLSIQTIDLARRLIRYKHIGGVTRGMDVEWCFVDEGDKVTAIIVHEWDPPWPLPMFIRRSIAFLAGELFIKVVADRTLQQIKHHAELMGRAD